MVAVADRSRAGFCPDAFTRGNFHHLKNYKLIPHEKSGVDKYCSLVTTVLPLDLAGGPVADTPRYRRKLYTLTIYLHDSIMFVSCRLMSLCRVVCLSVPVRQHGSSEAIAGEELVRFSRSRIKGQGHARRAWILRLALDLISDRFRQTKKPRN